MPPGSPSRSEGGGGARVETPHGVVILVELGEAGGAGVAAALAALPEAERAFVAQAGANESRRLELVAGRTALRAALRAAGAPAAVVAGAAIGADDRGAPVLPAGWIGSVSHKGGLAAAIAAPAGGGGGGGWRWIGVDLERAEPPRFDIGRRILTAREQAVVPDRGRAVTLRFSIKEAIYKAIDPCVRRFVGFTEVELEVEGEGGAGGRCEVAHALPVVVEAAWREHAGHWISTARARAA